MVSKLFNTCVWRVKRLPYIRHYAKHINPFKKTMKVLSNDMPAALGLKQQDIGTYPEHADIVIIGGGFIGSSVAYWLKSRAGFGLSILVIEKDFTYKDVQRNVSLGTLTQHFSLPENIEMSQYSAEFLRNVRQHLNKDVDLQFSPTGSLVLASEKYADKLEQNIQLQNELGMQSIRLTSEDIKEKYPWINTNDIKLGSMAVEAEGSFNSWALLKGLIHKAKELDTTYVNAEVIGFELERQRDVLMEGVTPGSYEKISKVVYRDPNNEEHTVKFAVCVLAAGDCSGELAKLAKIGCASGILNVGLPIEKRKCQVYSIEDKAAETGLATPIVTDTTGLWLMRNGISNNLLCGSVPLIEEPKDLSEIDYFTNIIKPSLLNRVPSFEDAEINRYSSEIYDCNVFDNTGILGSHPYHNNLLIAAGFGKLGCQHAPAIGRSIAELIIDGQYTTIDLTRFGFDRLLVNEPVVEFNIY